MSEAIQLNDLSIEDKPMHCIIYGLAGCGKTHLAASFPKPMAVIDLDNKYDPMIGKGDIDLFPFYFTDDNSARMYIPQIFQKIKALGKDNKYKTIVIDSITALDRMLERYVFAVYGNAKQAGDRSTMQNYGDMKRWYRTFFPCLRSIRDSYILLLAHEQAKEDEDGKMINIRPFITGKMGDELSSIFEHTFHMKYVPGAKERWELRYKQQGLYIASSSIFSRGDGFITIQRDEDGYQKILEMKKQ